MTVRPIAYRRRPSPLHVARPTVGAAYGVALAVAALVLDHPLVLGVLLATVLAAGWAAGVGEELTRAARLAALPIVLITVVVNVLVSRGGLTVFARLGDWGPLGQMDLTLEALVYGLVMALRFLVLILACALMVATVDPDELLRAFRRVSHRSALSATLATRLVGVLGDDARRLSEAQRCRPDGGTPGARGRLILVRAVVGGALERSLDVAAALEVRGYGAARRPARVQRPWSRHDIAFAASAAAVLGLSIAASVAGLDPFDAYPLVHTSLGAGPIVLAVLLPALALAPFLDRRGIVA